MNLEQRINIQALVERQLPQDQINEAMHELDMLEEKDITDRKIGEIIASYKPFKKPP
jgi:hypothetical protein